jgi:hypothetical protein
LLHTANWALFAGTIVLIFSSGRVSAVAVRVHLDWTCLAGVFVPNTKSHDGSSPGRGCALHG